MDNKIKEMLVGLTIGDGYIQKKDSKEYNYTQYTIILKHCEKQKEYIEYKAKILENIFGTEVKVHAINNNGYPGYYCSKSGKILKEIRELLYPNGKKHITKECLELLTPETLAIWYMDDGSLSARRKNGKISSYEMTLNTYVSDEEHDLIIQYFLEKWNVHFSKAKSHNGYRLRCGTIEARKFIKIIDQYVIPSMKYKTNISKKDS